MPFIIPGSMNMWARVKGKPKIVFNVHWRRKVNTASAQRTRALVSVTLQSLPFSSLSTRGRTQPHLTSRAVTLNTVPTPGIVDLSLIVMKVIVTHQCVFVTLASHHLSCVGFYRRPQMCGMVLNTGSFNTTNPWNGSLHFPRGKLKGRKVKLAWGHTVRKWQGEQSP